MKSVSVRELRETLGPVLRRVRAGEHVVVTHRGKPMVRLIPECMPAEHPRDPYPLRGSLTRVSEDFDEPLPELWEALRR